MDNDNNQNRYVGDENIRLYTCEKNIAIKTQSIMKNHIQEFSSNKDFIKKSIELFHLLTYLDVNEELENIQEIIPNEPGDFLVTINGKDILYELVTIFGDKEAQSITNLVKEILGLSDVSQVEINRYPVMDTTKLATLFKKMLSKKKEKKYFSNYEEAVLLLVTSEHDRCGTVAWYLIENIQEEVTDFIDSTRSSIKTMNYFSSGKDGNPETNDIEAEIRLYNKYFNAN
ncbi:hypothetical protein GCM10022378_16140 [Salinicoccus jeotgali]|uniref:Uncharacterized protein n=1 Tax=Salinicoccus jeotgali TaxID=381634 RepID=A0ABP7EYX2_9STAP